MQLPFPDHFISSPSQHSVFSLFFLLALPLAMFQLDANGTFYYQHGQLAFSLVLPNLLMCLKPEQNQQHSKDTQYSSCWGWRLSIALKQVCICTYIHIYLKVIKNLVIMKSSAALTAFQFLILIITRASRVLSKVLNALHAWSQLNLTIIL